MMMLLCTVLKNKLAKLGLMLKALIPETTNLLFISRGIAQTCRQLRCVQSGHRTNPLSFHPFIWLRFLFPITACFQYVRRLFDTLTARGGTDWLLLISNMSRISLAFILFNRGRIFGTKMLRLRTKTGRSPNIPLCGRLAKHAVLVL